MNFHNSQTTRGINGGNGRIKTRVGQSQNQRQRPNQAGSRLTNLQRQMLYDNYPLELLDNYPLELLDNSPKKLLLDTQPLELLGK